MSLVGYLVALQTTVKDRAVTSMETVN